MSRFASLTSDIRADPAYLPPCPLCSYLQIPERPDIIIAPTAIEPHGAGRHGLASCCSLSDARSCSNAADVARWWRWKRLQPLEDIAQDNKRKSTLAKMEAAGMEPI